MPTSNNPHSEGELHQSEIQQKAASQPLEDAAQNETSTEAANRLHSAEEKEGASAEGAPADEESQQPATHTDSAERTTPENSNGKNLNCDNFFSKKEGLNCILFLIASLSLIFIICQINTIYNISTNHLTEVQKILGENNNHPGAGWGKINELRNSFQANICTLIILIITSISCFIRPISILFKRQTKIIFISIASLFALAIAATLFALHHFKYVDNITTISIITAVCYIIAIIIACIVCTAIKAHREEKGNSYTVAQQVIHYLRFSLASSAAGIIVIIAVLLIDLISSSLFNKTAPRTVHNFLDEFFNTPGHTLLFVIIFIIFLAINLINATSAITTIEEIFKNKRDKKAKKIQNPNKNFIQSTISSHAKLLIPLLPLSTSLVFIFVLIHYTQVTKNNLSTAIQITASQFADNKYVWLTMAFFMLLILYVASMPSFLLLGAVDGSETIFYPSRYRDARREVVQLYRRILSISTILVFSSSIINYQILKIISDRDIVIWLSALTFMSFSLCPLVVTKIFNTKYPLKDTVGIRIKTPKEKFISVTLALVFIASFSIFPNILLPSLAKDIGDTIASPGETLGSVETDYSCVFSNDVSKKDSISFGVITEIKPDSIHIFAPEYNHGNMTYGKEYDSGWVKLNSLVETQVKIPTGYHIEKFDSTKHRYNIYTGKCEYTKTRYSLIITDNQENQNRPPRKY
jgi:membrane protein